MLVPKYKDMDGEVIVVVLQWKSFLFFFPKYGRDLKEKEEEEENVNLNLNVNLDAVPTAMNLNYIQCTFVK